MGYITLCTCHGLPFIHKFGSPTQHRAKINYPTKCHEPSGDLYCKCGWSGSWDEASNVKDPHGENFIYCPDCGEEAPEDTKEFVCKNLNAYEALEVLEEENGEENFGINAIEMHLKTMVDEHFEEKLEEKEEA